MSPCGINIFRACTKTSYAEHIGVNLLLPLFLGKVVIDNSSVETWSNVILTLLFVVVAWNAIRLVVFHNVLTKNSQILTEFSPQNRQIILVLAFLGIFVFIAFISIFAKMAFLAIH